MQFSPRRLYLSAAIEGIRVPDRSEVTYWLPLGAVPPAYCIRGATVTYKGEADIPYDARFRLYYEVPDIAKPQTLRRLPIPLEYHPDIDGWCLSKEGLNLSPHLRAIPACAARLSVLFADDYREDIVYVDAFLLTLELVNPWSPFGAEHRATTFQKGDEVLQADDWKPFRPEKRMRPQGQPYTGSH